MPADKFLPALGHAISGGGGTAISTTITYPLDLINTRLKVQRQLRKDGTISPSEQYAGILDAFTKIRDREGGLGAFYAGLGSDVAKSVVDSFLFFLFYTWFRSRRSQDGGRRLPAWEELVVGAVAGACARFFTTPISNVVTRKQTASLVSGGAAEGRSLSVSEILHVIYAERGLLGLFSGYGATLVLTLNPSITFYMQQILTKRLVDKERLGSPGSGTTFLIAAMSKVVATAVTYPFQMAKARVQVSVPESPKREDFPDDEKEKLVIEQNTEAGQAAAPPKSPIKTVAEKIHHLAQETIFTTVLRIARTEGFPALYDGISGELFKAFFNHGTTMLSKDIIHKLIVQLYFFIHATLRKYPAAQSSLLQKSRRSLTRGQYAQTDDQDTSGGVILNLVELAQRKLTLTR